MRTLPNSASQRFCTSLSLRNKEKHPSMTRHPSMMKPQEQPATTTTANVVTLSKCTTSILMVMGLRKIGKRILVHPLKKGVRGTSITGQTNTNKEGVHRSRGPFTFKPPYCMYQGNDTNYRTKDCPIFLGSKKKMEQDSNQPPQQSSSREVYHIMQWAPPYHHHKLTQITRDKL
jgi:hypothetical protein